MSGNADVRYPGGIRFVTTRHTPSTATVGIPLVPGSLFIQFRPRTNGIIVLGSNTVSVQAVPSGFTAGQVPFTASVLTGWFPVGGSSYLTVKGNGGKSTVDVISALGMNPQTSIG